MKTFTVLLYVFCGVNVSWCYYSSGYPILYYPYNYGTIYYPRLTLPVTGGLQHLSSPEVQDINSPTSKAALAYLSESLQLDSCGQMTEAFMSSIQAGSSRQAAGEAAAAVYQRNQRTGGPLSPACASAEVAWRKAVAGGQDPVFPAALAYVEASTSDSPCLASAKDYLKATLAGSSPSQARLAAVKSFAAKMASTTSVSSIDSTCLKAAQAYIASSDIPSSPVDAAMEAYIKTSLEVGTGFDPVCNAAGGKFIESFSSGRGELTNVMAAAREFLTLYIQHPTPASRSPCAAAAKAYAMASLNVPDSSTNRAMLAFIDAASDNDDGGLDPVCAISAEAYLAAYLSGGSEDQAAREAAVAFLNAMDAHPNFQMNSPCGKAAQAYMGQFY